MRIAASHKSVPRSGYRPFFVGVCCYCIWPVHRLQVCVEPFTRICFSLADTSC